MRFSINEINNLLGDINWNKSKNKKLSFEKISIDSRNISSEDLFVAIKGNNFDGHNFIDSLIEKEVKAVIITKGNEKLVPKYLPFWSVKDTVKAFQRLSLLKRRKLNIPVIAITGSVGKTTTKEMAKEVLKSYGKVEASKRNNNNEIGVCLTINNCDEKDKLLILEMGMRGLGQIENLSRFSEPDIAVITNIGSSHIGLLGSRNIIAQAKCEIVKYLNPNGLVIIPFDEPLIDENLKYSWRGRILKVRLKSDKEENYSSNLYDCLTGSYNKSDNLITIENKKFTISFKGSHNVRNFLFTYAIAKELGIDFDEFTEFSFKEINGRNKIIDTKKLTILDESYNASPESVKACINLLLDYPGNHFLVFGSMQELGDRSIKYHKEIIDLILHVDIQKCIFLCNSEMRIKLMEYVYSTNKIVFENDINLVSKILNRSTKKGDILLIKGSRYWKLEQLISLLE
tara:strand:+ start:10073 stop:11443 length:1371 start_codon:yes stop_codon:yes gene_type:complete